MSPPARRRRSGHRMSPFHVLSALVSGFLIKVLARPGQRVAGAARENDLEELQASRTKGSSRTGQVQAPHSGKEFAVTISDMIVTSFKLGQPALARPGVMKTKVFDVQHAVIVQFKNV